MASPLCQANLGPVARRIETAAEEARGHKALHLLDSMPVLGLPV